MYWNRNDQAYADVDALCKVMKAILFPSHPNASEKRLTQRIIQLYTYDSKFVSFPPDFDLNVVNDDDDVDEQDMAFDLFVLSDNQEAELELPAVVDSIDPHVNKPPTIITKPSAVYIKPSAMITKPSAVYIKPSAVHIKPIATITKPPIVDSKPPAINLELLNALNMPMNSTQQTLINTANVSPNKNKLSTLSQSKSPKKPKAIGKLPSSIIT